MEISALKIKPQMNSNEEKKWTQRGESGEEKTEYKVRIHDNREITREDTQYSHNQEVEVAAYCIIIHLEFIRGSDHRVLEPPSGLDHGLGQKIILKTVAIIGEWHIKSDTAGKPECQGQKYCTQDQ